MSDETKEAPTRVVVGTSETIKVQAVQTALARVFPGKDWEIVRHPYHRDSYRQAFGLPQGFDGAFARAKWALEKDNRVREHQRREYDAAAFGFGIESAILEENIEVCCVTVLPANWENIDEALYGRGLGTGVVIPASTMFTISAQRSLGDILNEKSKEHRGIGRFEKGIQSFLTNGVISRFDNYVFGVVNALAQISHPSSYETTNPKRSTQDDDTPGVPRAIWQAAGD